MSNTAPMPLPGSNRRRLRRAALAAAGAAVILYGVARVVVTRPAFEEALRERIERVLRSRLGGEVTVGPAVHVDALFRVTFGPVAVLGSRPADPPVIRIGRVRVRPRLLAALAGRAEAAAVRIEDVRIEAGPRGRALADAWARVPRHPARRAPLVAGAVRPGADEAGEGPEDPPVSIRGLVLRGSIAGRTLELAASSADVRRRREDSGAERIDVSLALAEGGRGTLELRRTSGGWTGEARLADIGPDALPAALRELPVTLARGTLDVEAKGEAPADLSRARVAVRLSGDDVVLAGERIGEEPVGPLAVAASGTLGWDARDRRVSVRDGAVTLPGGLGVAVSGDVRLGPGVPFSLDARAENVDFAAVTAALPPGLGLPDDAPHPGGTLDAHLALAGPLLAPAAWDVEASLDLSRMREAARRAPPVALRTTFEVRPEPDRGEPPRTIVVGPRSPDFVPIAELPVHVVRAVTASEDGGFFGHEGFDFEELKNAFAAGAEKGRVVRGGSTITQQLAKNLYLSREKTVARKIREAAITIALEATVPKSRLLEIYLNVAEWGPGIHGIGPAARHWFGKDARDLSPKQAAFLATVIPNPVRYHFMWNRGAASDAWEQRVDELLLKMHDQGAIDDDALAAAISQPIVFHREEAVANP